MLVHKYVARRLFVLHLAANLNKLDGFFDVMIEKLLNVGGGNKRCIFPFFSCDAQRSAAGTMASVTMTLLQLFLVVSAASAWSSRYQGYYRFIGGSLTFTAKGSNGSYKVSQRRPPSERRVEHLAECPDFLPSRWICGTSRPQPTAAATTTPARWVIAGP